MPLKEYESLETVNDKEDQDYDETMSDYRFDEIVPSIYGEL